MIKTFTLFYYLYEVSPIHVIEFQDKSDLCWLQMLQADLKDPEIDGSTYICLKKQALVKMSYSINQTEVFVCMLLIIINHPLLKPKFRKERNYFNMHLKVCIM